MTANCRTSEIVSAHNGVRELRRRWRSSDPWASALIVHGAGGHSGQFERVGVRMSAAGIDTYAFDLQGCGDSGGRRADIDQWSTFLFQVRDNLVPLLAAKMPVVLFGHSLGGLIAVDYTFSGHPQPDLVALFAPAIGSVAPWQRHLARLLARLAPRMTFANRIDFEKVFTDPGTAALTRADPLTTTRTTARLGSILLDRMEQVRRSIDKYTAPTLVLHGAADHLVLPSASEALGALPSVARKTLPGIKHGSIIERQGKPLVDDIITWVREQTADSLDRRNTYER